MVLESNRLLWQHVYANSLVVYVTWGRRSATDLAEAVKHPTHVA